MALSPFPVATHQIFSTYSHSLYYSVFQQKCSSRALKFKPCCFSHQTIKVVVDTRKKRKPKPSFLDQVNQKWSQKPIISTREKFPWQEEKELEEEEEEVEKEQSFEATTSESESDKYPRVEVRDPVSFPLPSRVIAAPWSHGSEFNKPRFNFVPGSPQFEPQIDSSFSEKPINFPVAEINFNKQKTGLSVGKEITIVEGLNEVDSSGENLEVSTSGNDGGSIGGEDKRNKKNNTKMAERTIPEHELRRLRNVALRMVERTNVGAAGITQALVELIQERWKSDEVVKLKFEEPLSLNMKRTHEVLEKRTGGLVIWRSGGSVVLYRGMAYKLQCVQSYSREDQANKNASDVVASNTENIVVKESVRTMEFIPSSEYVKDLSKEELMDLCELNHLLDELGPRYKDWSGRELLPVDADLLPPIVPGYQPPLRRLPYGVRHCLKDSETTTFRRLARRTPPHFALGRNREVQGLAQAMVKLWERSAIAKIAIKRGVQNTRNERMAEELKIPVANCICIMGNDFVPPVVTETLKEMQKTRNLRQEEEEEARGRALALVGSNVKASTLPLVAGTLAETTAATSRWGHQPSPDEVEEMKRNSALSQQASLVRHLEKKLAQEHLDPADLPTDLETLSEEERMLFRKIGLSMKPYLLLGKRGVYDGTIENMHLHWKFRELVKILVKRESLAQVKHIAISLEAESGGVLVSLDKTTTGYVIIIYRGKNYSRPQELRPENLLTKRQALARSVELQRCTEVSYLRLAGKIESMKSELGEMKAGKGVDPVKTPYLCLNEALLSDEDIEEEDWKDEYLVSYGSDDDEGYEQTEPDTPF
ncbi:cytokinin dehydrogenase 3 [Hibiscus syriacus]|uniref:Cytokinin dehydrogenase 3 n=1 Tax=Hibiscus syriacus TaxID=106335 RepID=A0A6A3AMQ8_HIBSY|nr:cytokinin dehydrogenase 3 [Hibiscus syriacus]